jgi:hypothetical protein
VCYVDGGDFGLGSETCLTIQLVSGGVFLAIGLPVLIAGGVRRSRYKEWMEQHRVSLTPVITPEFSGAGLSLSF